MNYYIKFKNFINQKFGIDIAEWHSIAIGSSTAFIGGIDLFLVIITTAMTGKKVTGHLKDLKKEVGYSLASFGLIEGLQTFLGGIL